MRSLPLALAFGLAACAAPPEEPPPLSIEVELASYAGSLFEGPQPGASASVPDDPREALVLNYDAFYVQELPAEDLEPIARRTRLVFISPNRHLLMPTAYLARGALLASGEPARRLRAALRAAPPRPDEARTQGTAALPFHTTALVTATPPVEGGLRHLRFMLECRPDDSSPHVAVNLAGELPVWSRVDVKEVTNDQPLYRSSRELRNESLVLDEQADPTAGPLAFVIQVENGVPGKVVLIVELVSPPEAGDEAWSAHAERFAQCIELVDRAAAASDRAATPLRDARRARDVLDDAAAGLRDPESLRSALAHLASSTGAGFTADLALIGEHEMLAEIAQKAEDHLAEVDALPTDYGWALERSAVLASAARLKSQELPRAQLTLSGLHFGEAAYFPGRIEQAAKASEDRAAFLERIVAIHIEFLDTSNPATRVHAYDWLHAYGHDVPGYDPLAGAKERRAALNAYDEASDQP